MEEELLVRIYDVGFGDCIYIRIPDKDRFYNILIDCGSSGPAEPTLKDALSDVRHMLLNDDGSKSPLDLLVVTHPHADHIKGFDPEWFKDIQIRHIWLSAFMKEDHPQAKQSHALQKLTNKVVKSFMKSLQVQGLHLSPGLNTLLTNSIWNPGAMKALRVTLPEANKIKPLYLCRDVSDPTKRRKLRAMDRKKHAIHFEDGTTCFRDFNEKDTCLRVLAPEWNIDGYYLGKESPDYQFLLGLYDKDQRLSGGEVETEATQQPDNISKRDFRILRNRLLYSALAFSKDDSDLKNNTSVVLLLEWRGRRLLFAGDAEWKGKDVREGRHNGCWDVILSIKECEIHLSKPIDFLKVGHHGSVNGTPYVDQEKTAQPFLDKILPEGGKAKVVVSTLKGIHGEKKEVPYPQLMEELGRRIDNGRKYPDNADVLQPQRTDCEGDRIDTWIKPTLNWTPSG